MAQRWRDANSYHLNSADWGVPQTRMRLIMRAVRTGYLPPLPPKVRRWTGWYEAVEDLIPTLPESQFAPWQLARMGDMSKRLSVLMNNQDSGPEARPRPVEAHNPAFTVRALSTREAHEPAITVGASPTHRPLRAFLANVQGENGDILRPAPAVTTSHAAEKYRAFLCSGTDANTYDADDPSMTVTAAQGNGTIASRAFIVPAGGNESLVAARMDNEPAFTVMTNGEGRMPWFVPLASPQLGLFEVAPRTPSLEWLNHGRVVSMTTRCLARFQTIPDCWVLPTNNELACRIIGNGMPCLLAQRIVEGLIAATSN